MRLARFEDSFGRETYVNVDRVNYILKYGAGMTQISFGEKEEVLFVKMDVSAVASALANAGKA